MQYAIIGDIHSSVHDIQTVLTAIQQKVPNAKIVGTGDIFECTVSKKDLYGQIYSSTEDVLLNPTGFLELLTFPTVFGNQEERILLLTENEDMIREVIESYPEKIEIENAEIIHGHQWKWGGNPWELQEDSATARLTFYGHSHESKMTIDGHAIAVEFGEEYNLVGEKILINVGSVVGNLEWVLYDSEKMTIVFMKEER